MNEEGLLNATEMKNLFACRIKETVSLNERYGLISKVRMLEMTESFTHLAVSVKLLKKQLSNTFKYLLLF